MKTTFFFLTIVVTATLLACHKQVNKIDIQQQGIGPDMHEMIKSNSCLTREDAEKILGQTARLTENASENKAGIIKSRCTYTADTVDTKTNKTGNLYYLLEEFKNADSAQKAYAGILAQNEDMPGLTKLNEIGNQAFLHTDNQNFAMIISRKDNKILRLKVNKLTSRTSLMALQDIFKSLSTTL